MTSDERIKKIRISALYERCTTDDAVVQQLENQTFDKIVAEGLKLKKKCKSLRMMLLENETQRVTDRNEMDQRLLQRQRQHESQLSQLAAQHHLDRTQLHDQLGAQLEEAHHNLDFCRFEMERQQHMLEDTRTELSQARLQLEDARRCEQQLRQQEQKTYPHSSAEVVKVECGTITSPHRSPQNNVSTSTADDIAESAGAAQPIVAELKCAAEADESFPVGANESKAGDGAEGVPLRLRNGFTDAEETLDPIPSPEAPQEPSRCAGLTTARTAAEAQAAQRHCMQLLQENEQLRYQVAKLQVQVCADAAQLEEVTRCRAEVQQAVNAVQEENERLCGLLSRSHSASCGTGVARPPTALDTSGHSLLGGTAPDHSTDSIRNDCRPSGRSGSGSIKGRTERKADERPSYRDVAAPRDSELISKPASPLGGSCSAPQHRRAAAGGGFSSRSSSTVPSMGSKTNHTHNFSSDSQGNEYHMKIQQKGRRSPRSLSPHRAVILAASAASAAFSYREVADGTPGDHSVELPLATQYALLEQELEAKLGALGVALQTQSLGQHPLVSEPSKNPPPPLQSPHVPYNSVEQSTTCSVSEFPIVVDKQRLSPTMTQHEVESSSSSSSSTAPALNGSNGFLVGDSTTTGRKLVTVDAIVVDRVPPEHVPPTDYRRSVCSSSSSSVVSASQSARTQHTAVQRSTTGGATQNAAAGLSVTQPQQQQQQHLPSAVVRTALVSSATAGSCSSPVRRCGRK